MYRRMITELLLLTVLSVVALSSCGGPGQPFGPTVTPVPTSTPTPTPYPPLTDADRAYIKAFQEAFEAEKESFVDIAVALRPIDPPPALGEVHYLLAQAYIDLQGALIEAYGSALLGRDEQWRVTSAQTNLILAQTFYEVEWTEYLKRHGEDYIKLPWQED